MKAALSNIFLNKKRSEKNSDLFSIAVCLLFYNIAKKSVFFIIRASGKIEATGINGRSGGRECNCPQTINYNRVTVRAKLPEKLAVHIKCIDPSVTKIANEN